MKLKIKNFEIMLNHYSVGDGGNGNVLGVTHGISYGKQFFIGVIYGVKNTQYHITKFFKQNQPKKYKDEYKCNFNKEVKK